MTEDAGFKILLAICGFLAGALGASALQYATIIASKARIASLEAWRTEQSVAANQRTLKIAALEGDMRVGDQRWSEVRDDIKEIKDRLTTIEGRLPNHSEESRRVTASGWTPEK